MRRLSLVSALAAALTFSVVGTASAYQVVNNDKPHGAYALTDGYDAPGGRCAYGPADESGTAYLTWLKLFPAKVYARNTTSGRDHQKVSWQVRLQRSLDHGSTWQTIAKSGYQSATAYDDQAAALTPIRVNHHGGPGESFRGLMRINWYRSGSIEGHVTIAIEYYSAKWTVGSPDYILQPPDECWGSAD